MNALFRVLGLSLLLVTAANVQADWIEDLRLVPDRIQVDRETVDVLKEEKYGNFWAFPDFDSLEQMFNLKDAIHEHYADKAALFVFLKNDVLSQIRPEDMEARGLTFLYGKKEGQVWLFDNGRGVPLAPHTIVDSRFLLVDFSEGTPAVLLIQDPFSKEFTAPGGALRPGETPEAAARRKMKDELGIFDRAAVMYTAFLMNGPWKFLGEPIDGAWQGMVIPFRDRRPDVVPDPRQVTATAWVSVADLKPDLKINDVPINPLVTQFAGQLNPATSAQNHVVFPDGRTVDTWAWHL